MLTDDERQLRDALRVLLDTVSLRDSSAGRRIQGLAAELGWTRGTDPLRSWSS